LFFQKFFICKGWNLYFRLKKLGLLVYEFVFADDGLVVSDVFHFFDAALEEESEFSGAANEGDFSAHVFNR